MRKKKIGTLPNGYLSSCLQGLELYTSKSAEIYMYIYIYIYKGNRPMMMTEYVTRQRLCVPPSTSKREVCSSKRNRAGRKLLLGLDNT